MNRIVIFSSARSGGNLLDAMFEMYDGVKSNGEVFSRRHFSHRNESVLKDNDIYTITNSELVKRLDVAYNKFHTSTYRFHNVHSMYSYNNNIYNDVKCYKKILLYRENFLDRCVSLNIAKFTNKWHYTSSDQLPNYDNFKIHFNSTSLLNYLDTIKTYYNNILDIYNDVIVIKYEDLIMMNDLNDIIDQLDINLTFKGGLVPTKYINPNKDNYKCISNYNELLKISPFNLNFNGKYFS